MQIIFYFKTLISRNKQNKLNERWLYVYLYNIYILRTIFSMVTVVIHPSIGYVYLYTDDIFKLIWNILGVIVA